MIRLTHRRCRQESEGLADAAARQTNRVTDMEERLRDEEMAHRYLVDEIRDACKGLEYAEEAVIPEYLREQLLDAHDRQFVLAEHSRALEQIDRLTAERDRVDQGRSRMLEAAHEDGRLVRTYALMEGAALNPRDGLAAWLMRIQITTWTGLSGWGCQDTSCSRDTRELVWHPDAPERAHLACECGRVWPAGPGVVDRGERETRTHRLMGTHTSFQRRWSQIPTAVLEAIDRALPTPAQCRDREAVPA